VLPSLVAGGLFAASLLLLLLKPRRVPDWAAGLGGGLLMVALGLLPPGEAVRQVTSAWNVFLFFLGLGLASATADQAGVFRWAAGAATRWARGSQWRLLVGLYLVGVVVTAVLSNDATALLLTPVVFAIATRAGFDPRPYAFACALVANAASFVLPVSNPSNLLLLTRAPLGLSTFLGHLLLPSALALAVTLGGLLLVFRGELATPGSLPSDARPTERRTRVVGLGLGGLAVAYVAGAALDWPLGVVALAGAIALVGLDALAGGWGPRALAREVPWGLLPLFAGLLLLVGGAERVGLFAPLERLVQAATGLGVLGPPVLVFALALLANLINNLPAALVTASALATIQPEATRGDLAAAAIVGVNLGPNLSTVGSLATMLWLLLLRRRGLDVSVVAYLRVGVTVTVPALLAAAAGLWLGLR
jgi:arsenical pump membrane protein